MNRLKTFFHGIVIGSSMSIPGISGGTVAMMLGEYDRLLHCAGNVFGKPKQTIPFLLLMAAGGLLGILTAARLLTFLFSTPAEVPLKYAFLGIAAGCVPSVARSCKVWPMTPKKLLLITGGAVAAALLSYIPQFQGHSGDFLAQFASGLLLSAALVLPGISVSQTLVMLGLYEPVMERLANGELLPLIPMGLGLTAGIFLTARALSWLIKSVDGTYHVIIGFMLYSLTQLITPVGNAAELIIGIVCCIAGFFLSLIMTKQKEKHDIAAKTT